MTEERIGKYLIVREDKPQAKRSSWVVINNYGQSLGSVEYFSRWWQYVFIVNDPRTIFSTGCMEDIVSFVKKKNAALRQKKAPKNQEAMTL